MLQITQKVQNTPSDEAKRIEIYRKKLITQQQEFEQEKAEWLRKITQLEKRAKENQSVKKKKGNPNLKLMELETIQSSHSKENEFFSDMSKIDW